MWWFDPLDDSHLLAQRGVKFHRVDRAIDLFDGAIWDSVVVVVVVLVERCHNHPPFPFLMEAI